MTILTRIDNDCKCLDSYLHKLFDVLQNACVDDLNAPAEVLDAEVDESLASYYSFSHFVKPDMIMNIYSLLDYWMRKICAHQRKKNNLTLSYNDIRGNNDLHTYQKYLSRYVRLNFNEVEISYSHLNNLRKIRNCFIHFGGHVSSDKEQEFSAINGITLLGSLIVIDSTFVWTSLYHVKKYLCVAAKA